MGFIVWQPDMYLTLDIRQIDSGNPGQKSREASRIRDDMLAVLHHLGDIFS